jgi:hypothetical protein
MNKEDIINELVKLPDAINEQVLELYKTKKMLDEKNLVIKQNELLVIKQVAEAVDDNGKPLYSNQLKRDVQCDIMLKENSNYLQLIEERDQLKNEVDRLNINLEFVNNRFKSIRAITKLL